MFNLKISKSLLIYVSIFAFLVLIYGHIFNYLMHTYEGKDYSFITSIYWVIVSMTTVGYGKLFFTHPLANFSQSS
jgi:ABC-type tungstate transport system substrate-binding protein